MSYTEEEQKLGPPIEAYLDASEALMETLSERIKAVETWTAEHLHECLRLKAELDQFNLSLRILKKKTQ